jgi:hypothetical protein
MAENKILNGEAFMKKQLILLACMVAIPVQAAAWRPTDRMLHAVRTVESAQGLFTWGDNGNSLGDYQISEAAWMDVTSWRKGHDLPTYSYQVHVWNKEVSRSYAADYLGILHRALQKRLNRKPNAAELYAAYNMGLGSFAQCQYQLARVNPVTARKCQQVKALADSR